MSIFGLDPEWTAVATDALRAAGNKEIGAYDAWSRGERQQAADQRAAEQHGWAQQRHQAAQQDTSYEDQAIQMLQEQYGMSPDVATMYVKNPQFKSFYDTQNRSRTGKTIGVAGAGDRNLLATKIKQMGLADDAWLDFDGLSKREQEKFVGYIEQDFRTERNKRPSEDPSLIAEEVIRRGQQMYITGGGDELRDVDKPKKLSKKSFTSINQDPDYLEAKRRGLVK